MRVSKNQGHPIWTQNDRTPHTRTPKQGPAAGRNSHIAVCLAKRGPIYDDLFIQTLKASKKEPLCVFPYHLLPFGSAEALELEAEDGRPGPMKLSLRCWAFGLRIFSCVYLFNYTNVHTYMHACIHIHTWKTIVPLIKGGAVFVSIFTCVGGKNSPVVILHLFLAPCPFPSLQTQIGIC